MRAHITLWMAGAITASAAVSAVALGQGSTWGGGATRSPSDSAPDAGAAAPASSAAQPAVSTWGRPASDATDAGVEPSGAAMLAPATDAGIPAPATPDASSGSPARGEDAGDDGGAGYEPTNVGFSVGLRAGYAVPFGSANGTPLNGVVLGMVPVGAEAGWFFNPHLYVGGYFFYGFGIGADQNNDQCGGDVDCEATMIRFGVVAHYHFAPDAMWDPWVGAGLGYEIINFTSTDQTDDSNPLSSSLQGVDVTVEAGLDLKPLRYLGLGPYVELATGPYLGTDTFGMHGWVSFGARFRTNL